MDKICAESKMDCIITRGPGMFTTKEFAMRYNIADGTASDRLRKLVAKGSIEFLGIGSQREKFYRIKS